MPEHFQRLLGIWVEPECGSWWSELGFSLTSTEKVKPDSRSRVDKKQLQVCDQL